MNSSQLKGWNCFLTISVYTFALLGVLFIPFPFHALPFQPDLVGIPTFPIVDFLARSVLNIQIENPGISSDSTYFFLLFALLGMMALLIAALLLLSQTLNREKYIGFIRLAIAYYLGLQLLKYGFGKVFKGQFYLPEPNILYTPFGRLDRDILYWSTIGTSYGYNLFLGLIEVIAGSLLLHSRTRLMGALAAGGILLNIMAVNFGFDISVKLFSTFLFFLSVLLIAPSAPALWQFFFRKRSTQVPADFDLSKLVQNQFWRSAIFYFAILLAIAESIYPGFQSIDDDLVARPYLHGAYVNLSTRAITDASSALSIERVFIHRRGYIIFQDRKDELQDFRLSIDSLKVKAILTDYSENQKIVHFSYSENGIISLENPFHYGDTLLLKALDWKALPVLKEQFHWTIESYK